MALDGIVIANLAYELENEIAGARIAKIAQPEADELLLTLKCKDGQKRLLLSANPSLPLACLTESNRPSPLTAPNFCMLLRKYIAGGRILSVGQPSLERVLIFTVEHTDELGDPRTKHLIAELMGKHSNIIFSDESDTIADSIKHVSAQMSSVREVLPGRHWFIPAQRGKKSPLEETGEGFLKTVPHLPQPVSKAIYSSYTGISPLIANELCFRAGIDGHAACASVSEGEWKALAARFSDLMAQIRGNHFEPCIFLSGDEPAEFSSVRLTSYADCACRELQSVSAVVERFYAQKSIYTRMRQKSSELRRVVNTHLDRCRKKYDLQNRQLKDTEKRERYRLYGELIHTYGYGVPEGSKGFEAPDYHTGETVQVPLDPSLTPQENAKKYFARYGKLKRAREALTGRIDETRDELRHLESIATSLKLAQSEAELAQIREELVESGYIRRKSSRKRQRPEKSRPYHYRSADGYDIYVGKNNYQNDELTFQVAEGNDWWFHAKQMPGSHVLLKTRTGEAPDRTFEDAAKLAAYYSGGRGGKKVEVDYIQKKHVKKPRGSRPGFVVYYTNYSMSIAPDISGIEPVAKQDDPS